MILILITGGAFQGKTAYARLIGCDNICSGEDVCLEGLWENNCINNYQLIVKRQLESGLDPLEEAKRIYDKNKDIVIISTEIGSGIIPIEKSERQWREAVGRVCCYLAEKSERVIRLVCGIPTVIKESSDK